MSSIANETTRAVLRSYDYGALSASVGVVVIGLLIVMLAARELARARADSGSSVWIGSMNVAIWPLLAAWALTVGGRLFRLL